MKKNIPNITSIKAFISAHKVISALVIIALLSGVYGTFKKKSTASEVRYVQGAVMRGTIASTVSGTGTVSASQQVDIKAKASGELLSVKVKTGDKVAAGDVLATIDPSGADTALRSAQIALEKLTQAPDESTLYADEQAVTDAQAAVANSVGNAVKDLNSTFLDLPTITDGVNSALYSANGYLSDSNVSALGSTAAAMRLKAGSEYDAAKREADSLTTSVGKLDLSSPSDAVGPVITSSIKMLNDLTVALRDLQTLATYVKTTQSNTNGASQQLVALGTTTQNDLSTWLTTAASHLSTLTNDNDEIASAPIALSQRQASLDKLNSGADPLDIESAQLNVQQKESDYDNYLVRAPFAGVVGKVDFKKGDTVSSGSAVVTLVTQDKVANISLNEVDAAKAKMGDKATMTFDAIDGLTITGTVSDLDLVGTVTQGVVTYNAKITFDTDDPRVLPSMSVSANVITDAKSDVLYVPSSAVKTDAQGSYVLAFTPPLTATGNQGVASAVPPSQIPVETGLTSDTDVEIVSGLTEGQEIVTRTINPTTTTTQTAPSLFGGGAAGGNRGGGAAGGRALGR